MDTTGDVWLKPSSLHTLIVDLGVIQDVRLMWYLASVYATGIQLEARNPGKLVMVRLTTQPQQTPPFHVFKHFHFTDHRCDVKYEFPDHRLCWECHVILSSLDVGAANDGFGVVHSHLRHVFVNPKVSNVSLGNVVLLSMVN